jgi:UDP-2,4-diacetamido-2,4,6-trideoxy-beta-L-altropyranose hydrolase
MKVAFRTDASREIGSGHVMRCLALAAELGSRGAEITFVCRALPDHYASLIAQAGHSLVEHDAVAADWLVVDHYGLDARWEREQRAHARKILAIDDLADRHHDCDVLVDQNLVAQERYAGKVPAGCELLLGPRFALLRPEFAQAREGSEQRRPAPRVLVMFGGADPEDLTSRCVELLAKIGFAGPLDVVAGPLYQPPGDMRSVTLHRAPSNIAELMARAELAIASPGVASWERCVVGLPTVAIAFAANQEAPAEALAAAGAHWYVGRAGSFSEDYLAAVLRHALEDANARAAMRHAALAVCDGRGAKRVADRMLGGKSIELRAASAADAELLHAWRNDERARRHFFDPAAISFADHLQWLQHCLRDPQRRLFIALEQGVPAGCLRLDLRDEVAEISFYVNPERFGEGIGTAILRAARDWTLANLAGVRRLSGAVLESNRASHAAFAAAGYARSHTVYSLSLERK